MAGVENGLFDGAAWVVTFDHALDTRPSQSWIDLWIDVVHMATRVGAEVIPARVDHHDAAVARISHLPHILAEALAIVGDNGGTLALSLAAAVFATAPAWRVRHRPWCAPCAKPTTPPCLTP